MSPRLLASFCSVLALSAPALAQQGGLRPVDGPPSRDAGPWLETGPQPQGADPLAPAAPSGEAPAPAPAPGAPAAEPGPAPAADPLSPAAPAPLSPEEQRKRDKQIDRNYKAALDIYEGLDDPQHQAANLDRRIANNERLVAEYRQRLAQAQEQRRGLQVDLFNRTFYLRQQKERGQITDEIFQKMMRQEERNYEEKVAALKAEIDACQKELAQAQQRLQALQTERRMLDAMLSRRPRRGKPSNPGAPVPAPSAGERMLTSLEERLRQLDKFDTHHTMEGVHPRDVGVGSAP